jgi:hypothetical protein
MPYPAPPGPRMPYDRDGSAGVSYLGTPASPSSGIRSTSAGQLQAINAENGGGFNSGSIDSGNTATCVVIFPELRDIVGIYGPGGRGGAGRIYTSPDTTNGQDGTWTLRAFSSTFPGRTPVPTYYRQDIFTPTSALTGIKAVAYVGVFDGGFSSLHIYGKPSSGQNPDSLRMWQPVTDAELTGPLDFGDVPRGSISTMTFRVKNISGSHTANGPIGVTSETLYDAAPSLLPQFNLSADGGTTWASSLSLPSLAPGAISSVLTVRDSVNAGAALGPWALRLVASAASWS